RARRHRDRALARLPHESDPKTHAAARDWLTWRGEASSEEVRAVLEERLRVCEAADASLRGASINLSLGVQALLAGDHRLARARLEQALVEARASSFDALEAPIEANLGQVALYEGRPEEAGIRLTAAARGAVQLGEPDKLQEVLIALAAAADGERDA